MCTQVRLVQVALSKLFPLVPVDTLIRDPGFFTYINQGLLHPDDAVRDLSSVVLARCLTWRQPGETLPPLDDSSAVKLVKQHVHKLIVDAEGLVTTLVNQIADTKISVAQVSFRCLLPSPTLPHRASPRACSDVAM